MQSLGVVAVLDIHDNWDTCAHQLPRGKSVLIFLADMSSLVRGRDKIKRIINEHSDTRVSIYVSHTSEALTSYADALCEESLNYSSLLREWVKNTGHEDIHMSYFPLLLCPLLR
jgi:hypothetical protein